MYMKLLIRIFLLNFKTNRTDICEGEIHPNHTSHSLAYEKGSKKNFPLNLTVEENEPLFHCNEIVFGHTHIFRLIQSYFCLFV